MVLGEVGKRRNGKIYARDTVLCQSVAGYFHNHIVDSRLAHFGKGVLECHRVGGGVMNGEALDANHYLECAYKPHFVARALQNGAYHIADGGFAVRPRYADNVHGAGGVVVEKRRQPRKDFCHIARDAKDGNAVRHGDVLALGKHRSGAFFDGGVYVVMPVDVSAFYTYKQSVFSNFAGIVGDVVYGGCAVPRYFTADKLR